MQFSDVRLNEIDTIIHYTSSARRFSTKNRKNHIIGIHLGGVADHYFSDRMFTLSDNCIYFFNQNEDYRVDMTEPGVAYSIHFTTFEPVEAKSFAIKVQDRSNIIRLMERIEYQHQLHSRCTAGVMSDFYRLLSAFEEVYNKNYHPENDSILRAREYMNLHFKEADCLDKAAELQGVSRRRFNDVFRENFNITPKQYLISRKTILAKKLLEAEDLRIGDIAELCGFGDVYHFSKTFKKETGQAPSE